jgi:hypothetical protein
MQIKAVWYENWGDDDRTNEQTWDPETGYFYSEGKSYG